MRNNETGVAIVMCYGVLDSELRSEKEMNGLYEYYATVARSVNENGCRYVVLAGGKTNPDCYLSEARSAYGFFSGVLSASANYRSVPTVFLEERSLNAVQNIHFALDRLKGEGVYPDYLYVYCDKVRLLPTMIRVRRLYHGWSHVVTAPRQDIHPRSKFWPQFVVAMKCAFTNLIERDLKA